MAQKNKLPKTKRPSSEKGSDGRFLHGNQFWQQRSKHGRDKLFETPKLLREAAYEYFSWVDSHPLMEETLQKIKVNGLGEVVERHNLSKMRPYTMSGLCIYLGCNEQYLKIFKAQLTEKDENYADFNTTICDIEGIIRTQKYEGASAGFFNPNLIARDLGLVDKSDISSGGQSIRKIEVEIVPGDTEA